MDAQYDAIIIGGGIGGTAVGALLAHRDWKVALFEKNPVIGGRCTSYEKEGFIVDLGVHLFGVGDKGSLGTVCRIIGEPDSINWLTIKQPALRVEDRTRRYSRRTMMEMVPPQEAGNLEAVFRALLEMPGEEIEKLWYVPLRDWISTFSTDPLVINLIEMINAQYFVVSARQSSTAEFIHCFREVVNARSSAYPEGGCVAIPRAFQKAMEKRGGKTFLNAGIKRVLVENGKATGIILPDGSKVRAPAVISNADIKDTVNRLTGAEHFPSDYVERVNRLLYAFPAVALKVALDRSVTDDQLVLVLSDDYDAQRGLTGTSGRGRCPPERIGGMITIPTNYDPSLAPPGCQLICYGAECPPDQSGHAWEERLMDSLLELYPQATDSILWTRLDTPEFVDAWAGEQGNIIGVAQTVDQIHEQRPSVKSPLPGLYFASAEAGGHGIGTELAASSALELASLLESPPGTGGG